MKKITPYILLLVLAGLVLIFGAAFSVFHFIHGLFDLEYDFQRVVVPAKCDFNLSESGKYTIFLETKSTIDGRLYISDGNISGLRFLLVNKTDGSNIKLTKSFWNSTYSIGGRDGSAIFNFKIDQPGKYELSALYDNGANGPQAVIAIGKDFVGKLISDIIFLIIGLAATFIITGLIVLFSVLKIVKIKRTLAAV